MPKKVIDQFFSWIPFCSHSHLVAELGLNGVRRSHSHVWQLVMPISQATVNVTNEPELLHMVTSAFPKAKSRCCKVS